MYYASRTGQVAVPSQCHKCDPRKASFDIKQTSMMKRGIDNHITKGEKVKRKKRKRKREG